MLGLSSCMADLEPKTQSKNQAMAMVLELCFEFAALIAIPLIIFIWLGKKLDSYFHTKYLILVAIIPALATSSYLVYSRIKTVVNRLKQ